MILRHGDPVSARLGMDEHGLYMGNEGKIRGFFEGEILTVIGQTSIVRFKKRIAPFYPETTWSSLVELCPKITDSDRGYVDEIPNFQLRFTGL